MTETDVIYGSYDEYVQAEHKGKKRKSQTATVDQGQTPQRKKRRTKAEMAEAKLQAANDDLSTQQTLPPAAKKRCQTKKKTTSDRDAAAAVTGTSGNHNAIFTQQQSLTQVPTNTPTLRSNEQILQAYKQIGCLDLSDKLANCTKKLESCFVQDGTEQKPDFTKMHSDLQAFEISYYIGNLNLDRAEAGMHSLKPRFASKDQWTADFFSVETLRYMLNASRDQAQARLDAMLDKLMPPYKMSELTDEDLNF